jgi:Flp pilus assembly pilin Flp
MDSKLPANALRAFVPCPKGAVAVEYGIIAMAMFAALIPAFLYVSTGITLKFTALKSFFDSFI